MNIAIHGRTFRTEARIYVEEMFQDLEKRGIDVQVSSTFNDFLKQVGINPKVDFVYTNKDDLKQADFLFSLGGDGTLLESVTHVADKDIPILGINTGRLGFLATTSPEEIGAAISSICKGYYRIDSRSLVSLESDTDIFVTSIWAKYFSIA